MRENLLPAVDVRLLLATRSLILSPVLWRWGCPEPSRRAIAPVGFPQENGIVKKN
ncbi:hypothetical protein QUA56_35005 [Microcoleus sp. N3A4]|uniref:hypothetical protein n=1 Tax=Microcoleus sp. N3A4 TaxID=3055379 RepID=UPI002FD3CAF8